MSRLHSSNKFDAQISRVKNGKVDSKINVEISKRRLHVFKVTSFPIAHRNWNKKKKKDHHDWKW